MSFAGWWRESMVRKIYRKIIKAEYKNKLYEDIRRTINKIYGPEFAEFECRKIKFKFDHKTLKITLFVLHPIRFLDYNSFGKYNSRRLDIIQRKINIRYNCPCIINIKIINDIFKTYEY